MQFMMLCLLGACTDKGAEEENLSLTGEISYKLEISGGSGDGTAASPITVTGDGGLSITVSQESRFGAGKKAGITRELAASIKVSAAEGTLHVESKEGLTAVIGEPETRTSMSFDEPSVVAVAQKFVVGSQIIRCNMEYNILHINEDETLPYVKLNQAELKKVSLVETSPNAYGVAALFELKLETAEVAAPEEQTLHIVVRYEGVVSD